MFCQKCGREIPDNSKVCQFCGAAQSAGAQVAYQQPTIPEKPKRKKKGCLIAVIIVAVVAIFFIVLGSSGGDSGNSGAGSNNANSVETTIPEKDYKMSCETIAYKDIARNPDSFAGKNIKFKGEVIQVQESSGNNVIYRINVTKDEFDLWDDTVYVTYKLPDGASRILEDDIVTFYGECKGVKSYTTVMGDKVTIPEVDAHYIVLDK